MEVNIDTIIYFIRLFITNIWVYYCFVKVSNSKEKFIRNNIVLILINVFLIPAYIYIKTIFDSFLAFVLLYFAYTLIISKITFKKLSYSMIIIILAYAILAIFHTLSVVISFIPYKFIEQLLGFDNKYVSLICMLIIEFAILYGFFSIKRFKNGFLFINAKLNNEVTNIIIINISTIMIILYCLLGAKYDHITWSLIISFLILGVVMYFTIQKMLTMHYKQKLLMDTMEEYKKELAEKECEIDSLKQEKKNVSKITHEFYNRQKALELLVASNMNSDNLDKKDISPNVLNMIESLTNEYSDRFEKSKELPKLEETEISEIDNMFKYMQSECHKNNINFKLKIFGNIHYMINNLIPKNKLETLIGDHLRDAINAINFSNIQNKEILTILGIKNNKYELSIYDTGVDFTIDTLIKLGMEAVTTNAERGGTGTGFMTTFETLTETNASLIITEYPKDADNTYTKCVTIKFDGKKQYKICSYRAKEIKHICDSERIKIEGIKGK